MATVIKIKNSSVTGEPADNVLAKGELAYSYNSNKLFIGKTVGGDIEAHPIGGQAYTDLIATDTKTFTAAAITNAGNVAITTTTNGDITLTPHGTGEVKIDSLSFDGNTITAFGGTNTNIKLAPQGTGFIDVDSSLISNVTTPVANSDAATKGYVDTATSGLSSDITISDNQGTPVTDTLTTGNTFTIAGTANEITTAVTNEGESPSGNATVTIGLPDDVTVTGDIAVNGGDLTTTATTFGLLDTNATTINFGGAATTVDIGASTGTTTINNGLEVTGIANLNNTTTSTTTATGALVVDGGVGIAENLNVGGNAVITGDLTVNGTTTTVNTTTTTLQDPIITLGGGADNAAPTADDNFDRGVEFQWHNGTDAKVGFFGYDDSESKFTFIADATNSSEVFSGTAGNVAFGDIDGANVSLSGSIGTYDGAAPTNGQLLIGNTTNGDFQVGTIAVTANTGLATPTLGAGTITLAGLDSGTEATLDAVSVEVSPGSYVEGVEYTITDPGDTDWQSTYSATGNTAGETFTGPATDSGTGTGKAISNGDDFAVSDGTNNSKGVASFASEQFTVTSGHVVVTEIDGGSF